MNLIRTSLAIAGITTALMTSRAFAAAFELTPAIQKALDKQKAEAATWAADPVIVKAVKDQNAKGPIADMDNAKWKSVRRTDPMIDEFLNNDAARSLKTKADAANGLVSEAFLSAAGGEKVAFLEKTSSYIHKGAPKFDVPFTTGAAWQGKAEFDESSQTYAIQVSVPVNDGGKAIGVLVMGVNLSHLEKMVK